MGAHLIQEAQTRDDAVVEIDQFVLGEFVDIDIYDCLRAESSSRLQLKSIALG